VREEKIKGKGKERKGERKGKERKGKEGKGREEKRREGEKENLQDLPCILGILLERREKEVLDPPRRLIFKGL